MTKVVVASKENHDDDDDEGDESILVKRSSSIVEEEDVPQEEGDPMWSSSHSIAPWKDRNALTTTTRSSSNGTSHPRRGGRGKSQQERGGGGRSSVNTMLAPVLKRVAFDMPLQLDSSGQVSNYSKSKLSFVTSMPVTRSWTASVCSTVGVRGRIGHSSTVTELRYQVPQSTPSSRSRNNNNNNNQNRPWLTTLTTGVTLTEQPVFHVGASIMSKRQQQDPTSNNNTDEPSTTTWSWKLCSPKPDFTPSSSSSTNRSWWMAGWRKALCKTSWSRDFSFYTLRSSVGLSVPDTTMSRKKESKSSKTTKATDPTSQQALPSSSHFFPSWMIYLPQALLSSISLSLSSRNTTHKWNTSLSWNHMDLLNHVRLWPKLSLSVSPQPALGNWWCWRNNHNLSTSSTSSSSSVPSSSRTCTVSGWYSLGDAAWSGTIHLGKLMSTTSTSTNAASQFIVGWTHTSAGSWTYLLTWSFGTYVLRIPMTVTSVLDPFWYPIQVLYTTLTSCIIQDAVAVVLLTTTNDARYNENGNTPQKQQQALQAKAKRTAENQQILMKRTADKRMQLERDKSNGLVITNAEYFTDREQFDVTIPLQFWVQDSILDIGPATKKHLLGFYDLSYRLPIAEPTPTSSWISGFWRNRHLSSSSHQQPTTQKASSVLVTPQLRIEYTYQGQSHQVVLQDNDEVLLPRPDLIVN